MRKFLGKIGKWMALRWGNIDLVGLTLMQLSLFREPVSQDDITEEERERFYKDCEAYLYADSTLMKVLNDMVSESKNNMLLMAQDEKFYINRISISAYEQLISRLESYASMQRGAAPVFDRFKIS